VADYCHCDGASWLAEEISWRNFIWLAKQLLKTSALQSFWLALRCGSLHPPCNSNEVHHVLTDFEGSQLSPQSTSRELQKSVRAKKLSKPQRRGILRTGFTIAKEVLADVISSSRQSDTRGWGFAVAILTSFWMHPNTPPLSLRG
jgi:hypothetical protein